MFKFQSAPLTSWQGPFMSMFSSPQGVVNVQYDITSKFNQHPQFTKDPVDWDMLPGGFYLALREEEGYMHMDVDVGTKDNPDICTNMSASRDRGLLDCVFISLKEYWVCNGKHHPKVHESWYSDIEGFHYN